MEENNLAMAPQGNLENQGNANVQVTANIPLVTRGRENKKQMRNRKSMIYITD